MEEIDKQLLQYIKDNYHIKYSFTLTPKQATEELKVEKTEENLTEKIKPKIETRGRPSYFTMVKEYFEAIDKDTLLLPEISEKLGIPTDKLKDILPELNYYYDESTRLWHKRENNVK